MWREHPTHTRWCVIGELAEQEVKRVPVSYSGMQPIKCQVVLAAAALSKQAKSVYSEAAPLQHLFIVCICNVLSI